MMYLSSYRMGNNSDCLRRQGQNGRAGIILNALDVYGDTRARNWDREAGDLERLGYSPEEVDLRQYFRDNEGLRHRLEALDLVWVVGGSAFALVRAMVSSGFAAALEPVVQRGLIYAGYSAGACVAGPDLRGIDLMDDPDDIPQGYDPTVPTLTLGLVPFRIVPHWKSDHPDAANAQRAVEYLEGSSLPYKALRDGEALVIDERKSGEVRS